MTHCRSRRGHRARRFGRSPACGRRPRRVCTTPRTSTTPAALGFIAHIKGRKSARHRHAGPVDPREPHASRRDGRRPAARRRRRHPDPAARRASCAARAASSASRCRRSANTASGMVFLPQEPASRMACEQEIERAIASEGQVLLGWRDVPTDNAGLSERTKEVEPVIRQVFVARGVARHRPGRARAQALRDPQAGRATRSRRCACATARSSTCRRCRRARSSTRACCSRTRSASSTSTSHDESMVSALAMVHQRFSTNTFPTWDLAHPFRFICHNGEINTLRGNFNWIRAREGAIASQGAGRRPAEALAADLRRPVRFGVVRQRARAPGDGRLPAVARDDDDDSRGVGRAIR